VWTDGRLQGGDRWREEISAALDAATVAVLLISQEFLASEFVREEELPRILERQAGGSLAVLPVYLSPSTVTSDAIAFQDAQMREQRIVLSDFQGFGTPQTTLSESTLAERKRTFVRLHDRIRELATAQEEPPLRAKGGRRIQTATASVAGQRPRIRIPFPGNKNFTGREKYLKRLHTELKSGKRRATPQALVGLGGIGKTQLALKYSYDHESDYDVLWWIRAEDPASRQDDVRALGDAIGIKTGAASAKLEEAIVNWLDRHDDWLLVFDDAEHPDVIRSLLPRSGSGRIIITSGYPAWGAVAQTLSIDLWTPQEAAAYLSHRTGIARGPATAETARTLGYLPLALAQAAAYVDETGSGFDGYLELLKAHPVETLKLRASSKDAENAVATVWDIAFERVGAANPAAVDLLNLFAFLPSDRISRRLLVERADRLPPTLRATVGDRQTLDASVGALRRYSLIDTTADGFSVHRLVQTVVRGRLDSDAHRTFSEAAVHLKDIPTSATPETGGPSPARRKPRTPPAAARARKSPEDEVVLPGTRRLWTAGRVPYLLSANLTEFDTAAVRRAIAHFEEKTILRFTALTKEPAKADASYIRFIKGAGDSSRVGMGSGPQLVTVSGSNSVGNVIHSIGHAVGLWHENSRVDRDKYVTVIWTNIIGPEYHHNFNKRDAGDDGIRPYDYYSIMHYPRHAFSRTGKPTLVPKKDVAIGQRNGLSEGDVLLINALYRAEAGQATRRP
jgi:hypothetical protein